MTTQPQSGAAMEPTQADQVLLDLLREQQYEASFSLSYPEALIALRQHVASETAELRKQLESVEQQLAPYRDKSCGIGGYIDSLVCACLNAEQKCAAQAAQIDTLRTAIEYYANEAHWSDEIEATEGGEHECKVYTSNQSTFFDNCDGWITAKEALAATTLGGDEKNAGKTGQHTSDSPLIGSDPLSGAAEEKTH